MKIQECRNWIDCLVNDAQINLKLPSEQIVLLLIQKSQELILEGLIKKGVKNGQEKE